MKPSSWYASFDVYLYHPVYWPGIQLFLKRPQAEVKAPPQQSERWAKNIPDEIMSIDITTLIDLWHLRFPNAPTPEEVIEAGTVYYEMSRRLWIERMLHKEVHTISGDTRFIVQDSENVCK